MRSIIRHVESILRSFQISCNRSLFQYGDWLFLMFFSFTHKIPFSRQKLRQSQCHGAPLLAKKLGNQPTAPANQELGEQEKECESLAAARRRRQHQRCWRRRKEWRRCTAQQRQSDCSSVDAVAGEARRWCTGQQWQHGCSSVDDAAVAAARQRDVGGSLAAARRQWQRQRRWRQCDSATSTMAAARQRNICGSLAAERRRQQHQRRWQQRKAWWRCTAQWWQRNCSSSVGAWRRHSGSGSVSGSVTAQRWRQFGGAAAVAASAAVAVQPKRGGGAQRDGGSAVGAAQRLRQIHRHRPRMRQRTRLRTPPMCRRTRLRPWSRTEGRQHRRHHRCRHDDGARGNIHCGRRCAAAAGDDADGDADNIVC